MDRVPDELFLALAAAVGILMVVILVLALVAIRLRLLNDAKRARWEAREARWTPVLLDILVGVREGGELQAMVPEHESLAFLNFLHRYSSKVRGRERSLIRGLALPRLQALADRAGAARTEQRARSLQILAELGMPEFTEVMVHALDDESPLVAMVAARCLLQPGNEGHFDPVLERLARFGIWSPRYLMGMLAGAGAGIAPALRGIMVDSERTPRERSVAIGALTGLHDAVSSSAACAVLSRTDHRELRVFALRLLERVGHEGHAGEVRLLLSDPDAVIRQAAAEALGQIGDRALDADTIAPMMADESPWVRMGAARALAALGAREQLLVAAEGAGPESRVAAEVLAEGWRP